MNGHNRGIRCAVSGLLALTWVLAVLPVGAPSLASTGTVVFINEIHYDNAGTDAGEAIEIAGPAGTDLTGWSLVLYNGANGLVYNTTALSGAIPDQQAGYGTVYLSYPVNGIQNGSPDGMALVDPGPVVVQFLSYEGTFTALDGPASGMTSVDIGVEEGSGTPLGYSLQLGGTGAVYEDFSWNAEAPETFGAVNTDQTFSGGGLDYTPIYDIQYTTDPGGASPYDGQEVTTEGVVTAVFSSGYFIEDPAGGPWNGLWVYDSNVPALGDRLRLTGTVDEYNGLTELLSLTFYAVESSGNPLPEQLLVTTGAANDEQYEGVLIRVENVQVTAEEDAYGEWEVDDGSGPLVVDNLGTDTYVPVLGDTLTAIIGPLNYSYSAFKIAPRDDNDIIQQTAAGVIINEADSDTPSYDELEFIELYDGGAGGAALDGLVVVLFNGNGDVSYDAFDLDGYTTDADGYFVIGSVPEADLYVDPGSSGWLQNGADAVALYSADAADFPDGTGVTTENLLDALVYDTDDGDDAGLLVLLNPGQPQINENGLGDKDHHSNQRCPNGEGGARNTDTYTQFIPTPGAINCELPPEACGDPFTPIYEVQGDGLESPLVGTEVALEGIVVGDFQNNDQPDNGNLNGFHVQDPSGDGNPATSDGVFVYAPGAADVMVGDAVRVRGSVSEYFGMTEVSASQVWLCSSGNSVDPTALYLPVANLDDFEPYEGMLVTFPQALTISEYYNFDRYGEIVLTTERQNTPTAVYEPGSPEQAALAQGNLLSRITLDDGRSSQNPDPAIHPNGAIFDMDNLFRGGDTVANVTGVLDYGFSLYRIQPVQGADYTPVNLRTEAPDEVGGDVKVASFNVLNYFTTIDEGPGFWICGPNGDQECRGADTPEEFERQRNKIIPAIAAINADVVGLIEIENHPDDVPTADLVSGLNDMMGAGTYDYIATGAIGTDAIRLALIYKPATVTPLGAYAILDSSVDPRFLDDYNRPVLAQTFQYNATGDAVTVAVNHLKSKSSDCNDVGDPDLGDGAGNCNLTRMHAAEALVDWLAGDPTGSGDPDALIIGDLNSYDKEDPIDVLLAGGYTDLVSQYLGETAYGYVFDGQVGYLDYALPNPALAGKVSGATVWHINADEPDLIDYDMTFKQDPQDALYAPDAYRSSDHDPVIVGLTMGCDEIAPTLQVSVSPDTLWPPKHQYVTVVATVQVADNWDPNPTVSLVSVTSNEPDDGLGDGDMPVDIVIVNDTTFNLRAERSGLGEGRVYTITYEATDSCGNSTLASATVTVPHDLRK